VGRVWSFRDVSERRRAEEAQRELESGLRRAQKLEAVGTLAGGIAHDFNNILTAIISSAEQAMVDTPPDSHVQESLQTILLAGRRAASLVRRILLFSRGEVGARSAVSVDACIRDAMGLLRPSLPASVEIVASFPSGGPLRILADATQVQQVLVNLCTNAWHAMRDQSGGRILIEASAIELTSANVAQESLAVDPGGYVRVAVTDNGSGIPPDVLPRIFDPFFTTKSVSEGTGLGLAMVHGIMRGHAGDVSVSSRVGRGTTFRLYFPLAAATVEEPQPAGPMPRGHGELVMIVDDESAVCRVGARTLEHLGYRAVTAPSGEAALAEFSRRPDEFALLVTDLTMPGMTGIDLARQVRARRPDLPVVLCTGFAANETEVQARELGIDTVLAKPHTMREFAAAIAHPLSSRR
jgi:nitrogen-specific signal transduction histidine kinase/CheY-like chemotaxis protein